MKRSYRLEGLDCANCAAKLERELAKIEGVEGVTVNFMMLKCDIEAADDKMDAVIEKAMKIIKEEEPEVEVKRI